MIQTYFFLLLYPSQLTSCFTFLISAPSQRQTFLSLWLSSLAQSLHRAMLLSHLFCVFWLGHLTPVFMCQPFPFFKYECESCNLGTSHNVLFQILATSQVDIVVKSSFHIWGISKLALHLSPNLV